MSQEQGGAFTSMAFFFSPFIYGWVGRYASMHFWAEGSQQPLPGLGLRIDMLIDFFSSSDCIESEVV